MTSCPSFYATWSSGNDLCDSFYFPDHMGLSTTAAAYTEAKTVGWT